MAKSRLLIILSLINLIFSPATFSNPLSNQQLKNIAEEVYIYAYPLVLMGSTEKIMTNVSKPIAVGTARAPVNQLVQMPAFPAAEFKDVVRPNVDTLYSIAWLDLSKEPMVLMVPDAKNRYYLFPMLDAWTEVFASPGTRTSGSKAQQYVIVGPFFKGKLLKNFNVIKAPTNLVWIIGRTQTNGTDDYPGVHQFQEQVQLFPLSELGKPTHLLLPGKINPNINMTSPPPAQVANMDGVNFFTDVARLMKQNPPHKTDKLMVDKMKQIGLIPGKDFNASQLSTDQIDILNQAASSAYEKIKTNALNNSHQNNGWVIKRSAVGYYGNDYLDRAVVAYWGLGANLPQDAIYSSTDLDSKGHSLNGENNYLIHFAKNQLPPVNAFWSLTLYGPQGYFFTNPEGRYALGDRDKLHYNADGSLDIYIQRNVPDVSKRSNWLPAPAGEFNLLLRLYWPKANVIHGNWLPPAVQIIAPLDVSFLGIHQRAKYNIFIGNTLTITANELAFPVNMQM